MEARLNRLNKAHILAVGAVESLEDVMKEYAKTFEEMADEIERLTLENKTLKEELEKVKKDSQLKNGMVKGLVKELVQFQDSCPESDEDGIPVVAQTVDDKNYF
jgi:cell shape-determining protein MreC